MGLGWLLGGLTGQGVGAKLTTGTPQEGFRGDLTPRCPKETPHRLWGLHVLMTV